MFFYINGMYVDYLMLTAFVTLIFVPLGLVNKCDMSNVALVLSYSKAISGAA